MKKYAINRLFIEIGRWCNMTCKHCLKGEREKLAIKPKYIDKFLDNIYLVNHLYFCGGEASFYIDEMQEILEIFRKKKVPLNYIRVNSNILGRNERFVQFLNGVADYATYPEVKLLVSKDSFHFDNMREMGIEFKQYEDTKQWYRDRLSDNIILRENSRPEFELFLEGKAKDIPKEQLLGFTLAKIDYKQLKRNPVFDEEIEDKECKMINAFDNMLISAEGYIYKNTNLSYASQRMNNHELSLGNVYADTLENLIAKWNEHCNNEPTKYEEIKQDGIKEILTKSVELEERVKERVYANDEKGLIELKKEAEEMMELFKSELNHFIDREKGYNIENTIITASFMGVSTIIKMIDVLLDIPNGFWRRMGMKVIESQKEKGKYENEK